MWLAAILGECCKLLCPVWPLSMVELNQLLKKPEAESMRVALHPFARLTKRWAARGVAGPRRRCNRMPIVEWAVWWGGVGQVGGWGAPRSKVRTVPRTVLGGHFQLAALLVTGWCREPDLAPILVVSISASPRAFV